jgi:hypothetical protein
LRSQGIIADLDTHVIVVLETRVGVGVIAVVISIEIAFIMVVIIMTSTAVTIRMIVAPFVLMVAALGWAVWVIIARLAQYGNLILG